MEFKWTVMLDFLFDGQWSEIVFDKNKSRSGHIILYINF